ncbi:MAG: molybdopterin-dependent oxidoreductase, partial [Gemmatimonadota bacterium]
MTDRRLDRRDFLRLGLVAGPTALVASCGWNGGPGIEPRLRAFSRVNDWVGEKLVSNSRLAREYPVADRTRDFPTYFVSPSMPVLPDPAGWSLDVGGAVKKPTRFTMTMLQQLPRITYTVKHHCVEGWTAIGTWTGVSFATIAAMVEPTSQGRYIRFDSFDAEQTGGGAR